MCFCKFSSEYPMMYLRTRNKLSRSSFPGVKAVPTYSQVRPTEHTAMPHSCLVTIGPEVGFYGTLCMPYRHFLGRLQTVSQPSFVFLVVYHIANTDKMHAFVFYFSVIFAYVCYTRNVINVTSIGRQISELVSLVTCYSLLCVKLLFIC